MRYIVLILLLTSNTSFCLLKIFSKKNEKKDSDKHCYIAAAPEGPDAQIALYCRINDIQKHFRIKEAQYSSIFNNVLYKNYYKKILFIELPKNEVVFDFSHAAPYPAERITDFAINKKALVALKAKNRWVNSGELPRETPDLDLVVYSDRSHAGNYEVIELFKKEKGKHIEHDVLTLGVSSDAKHIVSIEHVDESIQAERKIKLSAIFRCKDKNGKWHKTAEIPLEKDYTKAVEFFEELGLIGILRKTGDLEKYSVQLIEIPSEVKLPKPKKTLYHYLAQREVYKSLESKKVRKR